MRTAFLLKLTLASAAVTGILAAAFVMLFPVTPAAYGLHLQTADTVRADVELRPAEPLEGDAQAAQAAETKTAARPRSVSSLRTPMEGAGERVTKKPFGIEIHPETSPVENDRFDGYHVGVDFETTPEEAAADMPVYAVCPGPLRFKQWASGYGGVAVQACVIEGEPVSVIYGHLRLSSVSARGGEMIEAGETVGLLGTGESEETDGVRKHLHLGIRKGRTYDIRGYTKSEDEIGMWIDILTYMDITDQEGEPSNVPRA